MHKYQQKITCKAFMQRNQFAHRKRSGCGSARISPCSPQVKLKVRSPIRLFSLANLVWSKFCTCLKNRNRLQSQTGQTLLLCCTTEPIFVSLQSIHLLWRVSCGTVGHHIVICWPNIVDTVSRSHSTLGNGPALGSHSLIPLFKCKHTSRTCRSEIPSSYQLIKTSPVDVAFALRQLPNNRRVLRYLICIHIVWVFVCCILFYLSPFDTFTWRLAFARHFYCYIRVHSPFGSRTQHTALLCMNKVRRGRAENMCGLLDFPLPSPPSLAVSTRNTTI